MTDSRTPPSQATLESGDQRSFPVHPASNDHSGWVSAWRNFRDRFSDQALCEWLSDPASQIEDSILVELACLDLIHQRRNGKRALAEHYIQSFASLQNHENQLDVIDSEICVRRELGDPIETHELVDRFPGFRSAIFSLMKMDDGPSSNATRDRSSSTEGTGEMGTDLWTISGASQSINQSLLNPSTASRTDANIRPENNVSVEQELIVDPSEPSKGLATRYDPSGDEFYHSSAGVAFDETDEGVEPPDWFVGQKTIANGPDWWLLRGRHREEKRSLAMKVVRLPLALNATQTHGLLDCMSHAAEISHPGWVRADSGSIFNNHLGSLRPWIEGVAWNLTDTDVSLRIRRLASVAWILAFAHRYGVAHGGVHPDNIWIDHSGQIRLADAVSSKHGLRKWLQWSPSSFPDASHRCEIDVNDLLRWIASELANDPKAIRDGVVPTLQSLVMDNPSNGCEVIAECLSRYADGKSIRSGKLSSFWKRWVGKKASTSETKIQQAETNERRQANKPNQ